MIPRKPTRVVPVPGVDGVFARPLRWKQIRALEDFGRSVEDKTAGTAAEREAMELVVLSGGCDGDGTLLWEDGREIDLEPEHLAAVADAVFSVSGLAGPGKSGPASGKRKRRSSTTAKGSGKATRSSSKKTSTPAT